MTISIKLPLTVSETYGIDMITNLKGLAKQTLKNLVMTNPGEQLFYIDYGVGIESLLFSNAQGGELATAKERIFVQTKKYIPYISIKDCEFSKSKNSCFIKIAYLINSINLYDVLELEVGDNVG